MVHGSTPNEVRQDLEGMQNMRILARNMAWHLKYQQAAKDAGVEMPKKRRNYLDKFYKINNFKQIERINKKPKF